MNNYCMKCMEPLGDDGLCAHCGSWKEPERAAHLLAPGTVLNGRWFIGDALGQGGFGITYIGRDLLLDSRVAVKEYYPSGNASRNTDASDKVWVTGNKAVESFERGKKRFLREARTLARYRGEPGVVHVLDFFEANDTAYIAMEYLDGVDLRNVLKTTGRFPANWVFAKFQPIMDVMEIMHADQVVHRDVSPDNIMLLKDGALRLMDFGAARMIIPESPETHSVMLKTGYAPEEQYLANGNQGPWTDIYALSATMYSCITGITPVDALQRQKGDITIWPSALGIEISPECEAILKKGMAIAPEDRFQSISEMRNALRIAIVGVHEWTEEMTFDLDEGTTQDVTRMINPQVKRSSEAADASGQMRVDANRDIPTGPRVFCTQCGTQLTPNDTFCPNCGHAARNAEAKQTGKTRVEDKPKTGGSRGLIIFAIVAAIAVILAAAVFSGAIELPFSGNAPSGDKASTEQKEEPGSEAEAEDAIPVKSYLEDYSWEELSGISREIAQADGKAGALEVAKKYNLVGSDGKLDGMQTKMVSVGESSQPVHIIGFAHDKTKDGDVVGLTFQFVNCIDTHAMNYPLTSDEAIQDYADERNVPVSVILRDHPDGVPTNVGGWADSGMRKWLRTDILPELSSDMRNAIVAVEKKTDNVGKTSDTNAVTTTSDELWLPSKVEICGTEGLQSEVTKKEGEQYQLFKDTNVSATAAVNPSLKKVIWGDAPCDWWLRSPAPQTAFHFTRVTEDGDMKGRTNYADTPSGVSPCFCV